MSRVLLNSEDIGTGSLPDGGGTVTLPDSGTVQSTPVTQMWRENFVWVYHAHVNVDPGPSIVSFTVTPSRVNVGQPVTLSYQVNFASSITGNFVDNKRLPLSGASFTVYPDKTVDFVITALSPTGLVASAVAHVDVTPQVLYAPCAVLPMPIVESIAINGINAQSVSLLSIAEDDDFRILEVFGQHFLGDREAVPEVVGKVQLVLSHSNGVQDTALDLIELQAVANTYIRAKLHVHPYTKAGNYEVAVLNDVGISTEHGIWQTFNIAPIVPKFIMNKPISGHSGDVVNFWIDGYDPVRDAGLVLRVGNTEINPMSIGSNMTDADYVSGLYTMVLGRSADTVGFNQWLDHLQTGTFDRRGVMEVFLTCDEYKASGRNISVTGLGTLLKASISAPTSTTLTPTTPLRPGTLYNGWDSHVGDYEGGISQGHSWQAGAANAYTNPGGACDSDENTYASVVLQHTHSYAGCVWSFSSTKKLYSTSLNILSDVYAPIQTARSAGIWYSLNGGITWSPVYNASSRGKQWDVVPLPDGQNLNQVQVEAFTDAHDDMGQRVYDIKITGNEMIVTNPSVGIGMKTQNGLSQTFVEFIPVADAPVIVPIVTGCPTISGLSDTNVYSGDVVTIYGTNLTSDTLVYVGLVQVSSTFVNSTQITFTTPTVTVTKTVSVTIRKGACSDSYGGFVIYHDDGTTPRYALESTVPYDPSSSDAALNSNGTWSQPVYDATVPATATVTTIQVNEVAITPQTTTISNLKYSDPSPTRTRMTQQI